jgi:hypothetical protein
MSEDKNISDDARLSLIHLPMGHGHPFSNINILKLCQSTSRERFNLSHKGLSIWDDSKRLPCSSDSTSECPFPTVQRHVVL